MSRHVSVTSRLMGVTSTPFLTPHICSSRLDCHTLPAITATIRKVRPGLTNQDERSFQRALSFSVRRSAYSHIIRLRSGFWRRRQGLNLHPPPGAVLCRLSYVCISPQRTGRRSGISNSMSICGLTSGRQMPVLPSVAVLPSKTAINARNRKDFP